MTRALFLVTLAALALFGCRKDNTLVQQKIMNYVALCPGGVNQCYDTCGTTNNIGGSPTGSQMSAFESCKGSCDSYCNLGYILLLMTGD